MTVQLIVAGGGIGGLAAAVAGTRAKATVRVLEQAAQLREFGAGIQLGPNVTRVLARWGLADALQPVAARPEAIVVRDAVDGRELGRLPLGAPFEQRYGAPYLTIHRADLQKLLLEAATRSGAELRTRSRVVAVASGRVIDLRLDSGDTLRGDGLVAADGVWSHLRAEVVEDGPATPTGHLAYRALVDQSALPESLRSREVTAWLAPRMHVVSYPVRGGEALNVVALVEAIREQPEPGWDARGAREELGPALHFVAPELRTLVDAMPAWGVWSLHDRPPVSGAFEMARGRIALVGDAAHPMLPYLAQGAGMAIEDADQLGAVLADAAPATLEPAFARYAQARWQRCAKVQAGARRNAHVFHAGGALRLARNLAMRCAGERLIDQPWLYSR